MNSQAHLQIRERIEGHGPKHEIEYLCLDGITIEHFTNEIYEEIMQVPNVEFLTLNHCHIQSFENFP